MISVFVFFFLLLLLTYFILFEKSFFFQNLSKSNRQEKKIPQRPSKNHIWFFLLLWAYVLDFFMQNDLFLKVYIDHHLTARKIWKKNDTVLCLRLDI